MFKFRDLTSGDKLVDTFAYWLLVLKKPLPRSYATLKYLKNLMSCYYDTEEQAYTPRMLTALNRKLLYSHLRPIAPVTLALKWTPFALASTALGTPIRRERGSGRWSPALAIWKPKYLGRWGPKNLPEDHRHFVFLLRIACSAAMDCEGRVLLIGAPGWSYSSCRKEFMNPGTALLMHKAGYVYTERLPQ